MRDLLPPRLQRRVTINPDTGCHEYTGKLNHDGYARVWYGDRMMFLHVVVFALAGNVLPKGHEVDHLCRNRKCANLAHLEGVPKRVNILRGVGRGALNARKTHCSKGHPFDGRVRSSGWRYCRTCVNQRSAESKRRKKLIGGHESERQQRTQRPRRA